MWGVLVIDRAEGSSYSLDERLLIKLTRRKKCCDRLQNLGISFQVRNAGSGEPRVREFVTGDREQPLEIARTKRVCGASNRYARELRANRDCGAGRLGGQWRHDSMASRVNEPTASSNARLPGRQASQWQRIPVEGSIRRARSATCRTSSRVIANSP